jgi:hypothetical protein
MPLRECNLGATTADAEAVRLSFDEDTLVVSFVDWQEEPCELRFEGVLGFKCESFDDPEARWDMTYEVLDSPWLARQAAVHVVPLAEHAHYKLCFNAGSSWAIDVLCRRLPHAVTR